MVRGVSPRAPARSAEMPRRPNKEDADVRKNAALMRAVQVMLAVDDHNGLVREDERENVQTLFKIHLPENMETTIISVLLTLFPKVPIREVERLCCKFISPEEVLMSKRAYDKMNVGGTGVTWDKIKRSGCSINGFIISKETFNEWSVGRDRIDFHQLLQGLYPAVSEGMISQYCQPEVHPAEVIELLTDFNHFGVSPQGTVDRRTFCGFRSAPPLDFCPQFFASVCRAGEEAATLGDILYAIHPLAEPQHLNDLLLAQGVKTQFVATSKVTEKLSSSAPDSQLSRKPKQFNDELSEKEITFIRDTFDRIDPTGKGQLTPQELDGKTIIGVTFNTAMFKKLDKDKSGTLSIAELLAFLFPNVSARELQRLTTKEVPLQNFFAVRKAFHALCTKGKLDFTKLKANGDKVAGTKVKEEVLVQKFGKEIGLKEMMTQMYPSVLPTEIVRLTRNDIPEDHFQKLRIEFEKMDRDGSGTLQADEFNRNMQVTSETSGDWIRQLGGNVVTAGGMKFDMLLFNRIDVDRSGSITLFEMLKAFYPNVQEAKLRRYVKNKTTLTDMELDRNKHLQTLIDDLWAVQRKARDRIIEEEMEDWARILFNKKDDLEFALHRKYLKWLDEQMKRRFALELSESEGRQRIENEEASEFSALVDQFNVMYEKIKDEQVLRAHNAFLLKQQRMIDEEHVARIQLRMKEDWEFDALMVSLKMRPAHSRKFNYLHELLKEQESDFKQHSALAPQGGVNNPVNEKIKAEQLKSASPITHANLHTMMRLQGEGNAGRCFYSPSGEFVATCDVNGAVHEWDIVTGEHVKSYVGHTGIVTCLAYSADSKRLITGSVDKTVRQWDTGSGVASHVLRGHSAKIIVVGCKDDVNPFRFNFDVVSSSVNYIVSVDARGEIRLWDSKAGVVSQTIQGERGITGAAISPDGEHVITTREGEDPMRWPIFSWHAQDGPAVAQKATKDTGMTPIEPDAFVMPKTHKVCFAYCRTCNPYARHDERAESLAKVVKGCFPRFKSVTNDPLVVGLCIPPPSHKKYSEEECAKCDFFTVHFAPHGYDSLTCLVGPGEPCSADSLCKLLQRQVSYYPHPNVFISVDEFEWGDRGELDTRQPNTNTAGSWVDFTEKSDSSTSFKFTVTAEGRQRHSGISATSFPVTSSTRKCAWDRTMSTFGLHLKDLSSYIRIEIINHRQIPTVVAEAFVSAAKALSMEPVQMEVHFKAASNLTLLPQCAGKLVVSLCVIGEKEALRGVPGPSIPSSPRRPTSSAPTPSPRSAAPPWSPRSTPPTQHTLATRLNFPRVLGGALPPDEFDVVLQGEADRYIQSLHQQGGGAYVRKAPRLPATPRTYPASRKADALGCAARDIDDFIHRAEGGLWD